MLPKNFFRRFFGALILTEKSFVGQSHKDVFWPDSDASQLDRFGHARRLHRGPVAVDDAHVPILWRGCTALRHAHPGKVFPRQGRPALSFASDFPRLRRRRHSLPFSLHS